MIVIKRDGTRVQFQEVKIRAVLYQAFKNGYKHLEGYNAGNIAFNIEQIMPHIMACIHDYGNVIHVENIQDIIMNNLEWNYRPAAKHFDAYRKERDAVRIQGSEFITGIKTLLNGSNKALMTENANKKAEKHPTQRDLMAGEVSKFMARQMIGPELMAYHDSKACHWHDLDYFVNSIYNCELVDIEDMFTNGTCISGKQIDTPKGLQTAMTLMTQIVAQVASHTYGGQTISLSHIAPYVRVEAAKIRERYAYLPLTTVMKSKLEQDELSRAIKEAVQTMNYQLLTLGTVNGQTPFVSLWIYLDENSEYKMETAALAKEIFKQRIEGIPNENGIKSTQTFPKLIYCLDEDNIRPDSEFYWLTKLAAECTAKRMNPDFISAKVMRAIHGHVFPPMGCRAFLSVFEKDGKAKFYGRGNLGAQTINLPHAALTAKATGRKFTDVLDEYLEACRKMCELRYEKFRGVTSDIAPILWQHGAIARLKPGQPVLDAIDANGFTVTIGYSGIYEAVKVLTGESHTTDIGFKKAEYIMKYLQMKLAQFKEAQPHLRFALYGTPQESLTEKFDKANVKAFGVIPDITGKGYVTNSYHVDIRENINAFDKLLLESKLQSYTLGGAISYVETHNMTKNVSALLKLMDFMHDTILYSEVNFESDICGSCGYEGAMEYDRDKGLWTCPQCGCNDQKLISVVRRTCGYLGENLWTEGRIEDILNRVKHL